MKHLILTIAASFVLASASSATAGPAERISTVEDRDLVNLTVYNGGIALVHDRRRVSLDDGTNHVAWRDVSAKMDATSTLIDGVDSRVHVLEQNFDYDLLSPQAMLEKYVGRDVEVVHPWPHQTRETARVLSTNDGIVLQYRDRIETDLRGGYIVYPSLPPGFRDRPTLVLDLESDRTGPQTLDLSYITDGLTWRADYVGAVSADEKTLDLSGVITLSNSSGASYENARLQLVAGNVNIVQPNPAPREMLKTIANVTARGAIVQENYFEYHLYTLQRPTTVLDNQTKQVSLLSAHGVPIRKTLELRGSDGYYRTSEQDLGDKLPVGVYVTFTNSGGELGIPLPGGIARLYKADSQGTSQFLGEDNIDHTPRNEDVRLHMGDSFDVTARKKQTDFAFAGDCTTNSSYQIVVSNAKDVAQDVMVVEPIPAQWQITAENLPHQKTSASTATWNVNVPANGRATLTYTAHVTWCD